MDKVALHRNLDGIMKEKLIQEFGTPQAYGWNWV